MRPTLMDLPEALRRTEVALAAYLPGSGDEAWALGTASVSTVPPRG